MPTLPRFYCPTLSSAGSATLSEAEAHHLSRVLRCKVGDAVELFNGQGVVGQGVISRIYKDDVACDVSAVRVERAPTPEVVLGTAVPKGERFDWLVEKATELGVSRLVPLLTTRSTVEPKDTKLDRLRQVIISACKQSRRNHLMQLAAVTDWTAYLETVGDWPLIVADPRGSSPDQLEREFVSAAKRAGRVFLTVGPEGGWTGEELRAVGQRKSRLIGLGRQILRVETAGLVLATWGLFHQGSSEGA
jgi:16S rRNA (uracil1498-N3)-methyltransferase